MRTPRSPARVWIEVYERTMSVLSGSEANDVILFGSQALSVYARRSLASKDLDLIVPGITIGILEACRTELAKISERRPEYDFHVGEYLGRRYPVAHIYVKHSSGYPLVVEFFQTFLGYETTKLTPFITFKEKWGLPVQVLTPEAIIGTRLAFRPPERITPFNAARLSRFIRTMGRRIDWSKVNSFIDAFDLREIAIENIAELRSKHITVPDVGKVVLSRS